MWVWCDMQATMSCQRRPVRWLASVVSCPFVLKQKDQKFKADIIGPNTRCGRFPAMSAGPARPTRSVFGVPAHGVRCSHRRSKRHINAPLPSWRTRIRHPLHRQRTKPSSSLRVIARNEAILQHSTYAPYQEKIRSGQKK